MSTMRLYNSNDRIPKISSSGHIYNIARVREEKLIILYFVVTCMKYGSVVGSPVALTLLLWSIDQAIVVVGYRQGSLCNNTEPGGG